MANGIFLSIRVITLIPLKWSNRMATAWASERARERNVYVEILELIVFIDISLNGFVWVYFFHSIFLSLSLPFSYSFSFFALVLRPLSLICFACYYNNLLNRFYTYALFLFLSNRSAYLSFLFPHTFPSIFFWWFFFLILFLLQNQRFSIGFYTKTKTTKMKYDESS